MTTDRRKTGHCYTVTPTNLLRGVIGRGITFTKYARQNEKYEVRGSRFRRLECQRRGYRTKEGAVGTPFTQKKQKEKMRKRTSRRKARYLGKGKIFGDQLKRAITRAGIWFRTRRG